jgi:hypothetical protein
MQRAGRLTNLLQRWLTPRKNPAIKSATAFLDPDPRSDAGADRCRPNRDGRGIGPPSTVPSGKLRGREGVFKIAQKRKGTVWERTASITWPNASSTPKYVDAHGSYGAACRHPATET